MGAKYFSAKHIRCCHFLLGIASLYDAKRFLDAFNDVMNECMNYKTVDLGNGSFCRFRQPDAVVDMHFFVTLMLSTAFSHSGFKMIHYGATGNLNGFYPYLRNTLVGIWAANDINETATHFYKNLREKPMDEWTVFRVNDQAVEELAYNFGMGILN